METLKGLAPLLRFGAVADSSPDGGIDGLWVPAPTAESKPEDALDALLQPEMFEANLELMAGLAIHSLIVDAVAAKVEVRDTLAMGTDSLELPSGGFHVLVRVEEPSLSSPRVSS